MMFNTDFEVFYDVDVDEEGDSSCEVSAASVSCLQAATYGKASSYATNQTLWIEEFSNVFTLMIENGYEEGDLSSVS